MNEEVQDEISSESFNINDADIKFTNYLISYEKYNKERYYLSKNGMGERLLARALRRLPNLASVDVVFSSPWIGARMILGQMHGVSGLEYDFSSSEPINTLFHSIIQASIRLKSLRFMNADDVLLVGGVNDHDYRTLGKETRPYKSLAVPNGDEASGSTFSESRKLIAYLTNESSALRGLETFEILRISSEETPQRPQTFWESVSVCLINNAPTLRILQIGGELVGWETYAISKAMSDTTFPVLVTLSMTEMFFSKAELLIDIINATPNVQEYSTAARVETCRELHQRNEDVPAEEFQSSAWPANRGDRDGFVPQRRNRQQPPRGLSVS
ncbi:uncharacterized protein KY384_004710 [Bacidia gigantensis]|uniref:uncharacterized protein n=1 Tax=Bacidia gigantensis TaxID=2732470 RepID=UPI001D048543|nr:uncharacterized protein KY384_004710 [Bacidia gigantensis]KAG8530210.1 hypothetical protein KY384_004710 [Bacidia gigantensis]